jgi:hypothetical protein
MILWGAKADVKYGARIKGSKNPNFFCSSIEPYPNLLLLLTLVSSYALASVEENDVEHINLQIGFLRGEGLNSSMNDIWEHGVNYIILIERFNDASLVIIFIHIFCSLHRVLS